MSAWHSTDLYSTGPCQQEMGKCILNGREPTRRNTKMMRFSGITPECHEAFPAQAGPADASIY